MCLGAEAKDNLLSDRHILVVDDREEIRYLVSRYITDEGGRADGTADGRSAIAAVKATEADPFDAVILDIQMPGMSGYEVARTLRAENFHIPIIALSAGAMVNDREKSLQAGCDDYLPKPIDRRKLAQLLGRYTKQRRR